MGVDRTYVASLWHRLMQGLGYERYGAHGSDFGAGVATFMALNDPARLSGIHLSTPEVLPYLGPGSPPLTPTEQAYLDQVARWDETERGYSAIQSTRPQTLGYGLTDSPAGLAAWLAEKWRAWSDSGGDVDGRIGRDALLTTITLYWATGNPWPDSDDRERGGDNLFTNCVLALDPANGKLKWHYQFTPHDVHDWDATEPNVLVDTKFRGEDRKLLLHADRNGFFYVLDRTSGKLLVSEKFMRRLTWASGIGRST